MSTPTYDDGLDDRTHDPDRAHPLVDVWWLATHLREDGLTVLDASLPPHDAGGVGIPGARRFDLEGAFSDPEAPLPHTMPSAEAFEVEARRLGVADEGTVVVYDARELFSAARAWWMFAAMGHQRVAVLDGGLAAWRAAGFDVEPLAAAEAERDDAGSFVAAPVEGMIVDADAVADALADDDAAVLDARSHGRFVGADPEPREGLRGGHMPGAGNLPYLSVQDDGRMRPSRELADAVREAAGGRRRLVFSCGSGVTACVGALAARMAGYGDVAVYDGSWTQWGAADSGRPVVTGEA